MSRIRKEADKANVEIARFSPSTIKIMSDRTKLHIESETVLDKLIKEAPQKAETIDISGLQGTGTSIFTKQNNFSNLQLFCREQSYPVLSEAGSKWVIRWGEERRGDPPQPCLTHKGLQRSNQVAFRVQSKYKSVMLYNQML